MVIKTLTRSGKYCKSTKAINVIRVLCMHKVVPMSVPFIYLQGFVFQVSSLDA